MPTCHALVFEFDEALCLSTGVVLEDGTLHGYYCFKLPSAVLLALEEGKFLWSSRRCPRCEEIDTVKYIHQHHGVRVCNVCYYFKQQEVHIDR